MSKYSSDSDTDYKSKKSKRRKYRSESSSSDDSYRSRRDNRRCRKFRSRSRDKDTRNSSRSTYKASRDATKSRNRTRRSKSPYKSRRYRSTSKSRSRSRSPSNYTRNKSKRKYRSRSRSRSPRKRSRSRQRYHRSRSRSSSCKNARRASEDYEDSKQPVRNVPGVTTSSVNEVHNLITLSSDDPVLKQEQLDNINATSFTQTSFISSRSQNNESVVSERLAAIRNEVFEYKNNNGNMVENKNSPSPILEKRKNETIFHDSIVFEDAEEKIRKWVKKMYEVRQKRLMNS